MNQNESLHAAIHEQVELRTHDPAWPAAYELERARLLHLFPDELIALEHIGSTAIPGMEAKPIIDILGGVVAMRTAESLAVTLVRVGYTTSAEFNATLHDRKWFMRWADGRRTHHLHLVVHGEGPWRERIRFRDVLRSRPDLAAEYVDLKRELIRQWAHDREAYTNAKTTFVKRVLEHDEP